MKDNEIRTRSFDVCPGCGSTERFVEREAREAGLENPKMYGLNCRPGILSNGVLGPKVMALPIFYGPVIDDMTMSTALIEHRFPVFATPVDSCCDCGMIWTIQQQVSVGKKLPEKGRGPGL